MNDRSERILLIDEDHEWSDRFVNALQVRGWNIHWSQDVDSLFEGPLYSVYLLNVSHRALEPRSACQHIRSLPKGENASIFLLNDGRSPLKSFEEALTIKADGLYFHHTQLPLLLANFPPKRGGVNPLDAQNDRALTLSSRNVGGALTLGPDRDRHNPTPLPRPSSSSDITGMSIGHHNRQRLSFGYQSDSSLNVSDIEAALSRIKSLDAHHDHSNLIPLVDSGESQGLLWTNQEDPAEIFSEDLQAIHSESLDPPSVSPKITEYAERASSSRRPLSYIQENTEPKLEFKPRDQALSALSYTPAPPSASDILAHSYIHEYSFAECVSQMIIKRRSVTVHVIENSSGKRASREWLFYFAEGELIGIDGGHLDSLLVRHLIANGVIQQTFAQQILSQKRSNDEIIEMIVERHPQLIDLLEESLREVAILGFRQPFELTEGEILIKSFERPNERINFNRSTVSLLVDGIQRGYGRLRLYSQFTTIKALPLTDNSCIFSVCVSDRERALLEGAQGVRTIAELAGDAGITPLDALGLCYAFSLLGELRIIENNPLTEFYSRACTDDYFQLLSLSFSASSEEVDVAWRTHRQWVGEQRGDAELVQILIDILNDAYCVLMHPPLRSRYLASLRKPVYSEMSIVPEEMRSTSDF